MLLRSRQKLLLILGVTISLIYAMVAASLAKENTLKGQIEGTVIIETQKEEPFEIGVFLKGRGGKWEAYRIIYGEGIIISQEGSSNVLLDGRRNGNILKFSYKMNDIDPGEYLLEAAYMDTLKEHAVVVLKENEKITRDFMLDTANSGGIMGTIQLSYREYDPKGYYQVEIKKAGISDRRYHSHLSFPFKKGLDFSICPLKPGDYNMSVKVQGLPDPLLPKEEVLHVRKGQVIPVTFYKQAELGTELNGLRIELTADSSQKIDQDIMAGLRMINVSKESMKVFTRVCEHKMVKVTDTQGKEILFSGSCNFCRSGSSDGVDTSCFSVLEPGEFVICSISLSRNKFEPGEYKIVVHYHDIPVMAWDWGQEKMVNISAWSGDLLSNTLSIKVEE